LSEQEYANLQRAKDESAKEVNIEKEALLYEIELLEKQGLIKLHRTLTMSNSLDEIQYQYDRANMIVSTQQTVDWAKTAIKMGSSVLEAFLKRFGINIVDGFSSNLCKDMTKFNKPLTKMYRKYWRRGSSSPEMELAWIVFGALAMTVIGNKGFLGGTAKPTEPMARTVPPPISTAKPPVAVSAEQTKIPEWAQAALQRQQQMKKEEKPLDDHDRNIQIPSRPIHYAKFEDTVSAPKVSVEQPIVLPVVGEAPEVTQGPVVKRLTLQTPRSARRSRKPQSEGEALNLDQTVLNYD